MDDLKDDLRKDFEAAFEEAEKNVPPDKPEIVPETSTTETSEPEVKEEAKPEVTPEKTDVKTDKTDVKTEEKAEKAPSSWNPAARETWSKLPKEAQAEIAKREREISKVLAESKPARQAMQELNTVLAPHRDRLMAAGVNNPIQMLGSMLQFESQLRVGSQHTKAEAIASLIKDYGVDINALDNVLAGTGVQSPQSDIERLLEERLAPVNQFLQQQQQYTNQQKLMGEHQAAQTVSQFSQQAEFMEDVRMDMADLLDLAAQRGQTLTLEDAYKKACAIHPEVSRVMAERERQQNIMGTNNSAAAKRNAAVSITGNQHGTTATAPNSLRDQIAQAWNDQLG